jgi:hypothetical protein
MIPVTWMEDHRFPYLYSNVTGIFLQGHPFGVLHMVPLSSVKLTSVYHTTLTLCNIVGPPLLHPI